MDSTDELKAKAEESLKLAEHMLIKTYPLANDPKIILAVAEDTYIALQSIILSLGIKPEDFPQKAEEIGFKSDEIELFSRLKAIIKEHEDSPVEFSRKDKFVICDDFYNTDSITLDDMKKYLFRARLFVEKAENITDSKENN